MRHLLRTSLLLAMAVCLYAVPLRAFVGKDTPKDVAATAAAARRDSQIVIRDSDRFTAKVAKDLRFTSQLMEIAKGKDKEAIASYVKKAIGAKSEITVEEIDTDWCLTISFKVRKFAVKLSIGTTCR